ncbi:oligopeptide ABC transporter substrate-binding protein [Barrientosiimonas marina]|uniref:Oligopeptide ABC transporter substrate-binding protein n=1 Tax=Lentibacillus kimchii TaxID=1542911 RepID=A0ABW2UR94_9BACI
MAKSYLFKTWFALMLVLLLTLSACSGESDEAEDNTDDGKDSEEQEGDSDEDKDGNGDKAEASDDKLYSIDDFDPAKTNEGEPMDGGTLNYGLVTDTAFEGSLNWQYYDGTYDGEILDWFGGTLLDFEEYTITKDGAATYEVSDDDRTFTFTIRDDVNWHDGEPVTAEDWEFAHEVIGHPDYDGPRYTADFRNIEGMDAYHNGEADSISGIEVVDDKTMKVTFKEATPSLKTGAIWSYPMAKHIFGDMPVGDIPESPEVRENPIGFGPYKVEEIVPGESVTLSAYEDYWRGEPNLDKVIIKTVNPNTVVQAYESGKVDIVDSFPADQYPENADMSNVEYLGTIDRSYTYIGFKLGTWDNENDTVAPDPDAKMANKKLRQAMWHAVDNDTVGEKFYHGLRWNATTLIPPSHPTYHDDDNMGRKFDPEKAKKLLDEAGYKDTNDDGFREDPDGEELVINFASMSGGDTAEPLAKYYIQAWEKVGLNVELLNGRLLEFNTFYEKIGQTGEDDPEVDIYQGAWSVAFDVNPQGLYGRDALFNFSRYASEENDELLEKGISEKAFDQDYRQDVYNDWQELMVEEVPVFPTLYRSAIVPVNNRVVNYDITIGTTTIPLNEIGVTQEEPYTAD